MQLEEILALAGQENAQRLLKAMGKIHGKPPAAVFEIISGCDAVRRMQDEKDIASFWTFAAPDMLEALASFGDRSGEALEVSLSHKYIKTVKDCDIIYAFVQKAIPKLVDYAGKPADIGKYATIVTRFAEAGSKKKGFFGPYLHFNIVYNKDIEEVMK